MLTQQAKILGFFLIFKNRLRFFIYFGCSTIFKFAPQSFCNELYLRNKQNE